MHKMIWITGISKSGGNEYLEGGFLQLCKKNGKKVKIIYPGKMIFDPRAAGIELDQDNVLNASDDHLRVKMKWVFKEIRKDLDESSEKYDAIIIKTHRLFLWKNVIRLTHAYEDAVRFRLDLMVTFVDGIVPVLNRLRVSAQFGCQNYSKEDICNWQHLEISLTREWADMLGKKHFALPSGESPELLYELIFNPNAEPTYVAVDISRSIPEVGEYADVFIKRVRKYLPCTLDPRVVALVYEDKNRAERSHIVRMCLDCFVPQAKNVIGYYSPIVLPTSEGKTHELGEASVFTKNVWVVYLPGLDKVSPFVEEFASVPVFETEEAFFKFLGERQKIRGRRSWPEHG